MKALRASALALTVLAGLLTVPTAALAVTTSVFPATRDTYVNASSPTTNYNDQRQLAVAGDPSRISYLAFAVSGLTAPVLRAWLRLHTSDVSHAGSPNGGQVYRVGSVWSESTVTYANRPGATGTELGRFGRIRANSVYEVDVTAAVTGDGVLSLGIYSISPDGAYYDSREAGARGPQLVVYTGVPGTDETVLLAAGDIASCSTERDEQTARILDVEPGVVAPLGDVVYEKGTPEEFANCYHPTWGRHKARTRPAVGNHEYLTPGATGYYAYFGAAAGPADKGWYSYDLADGGWHVVVLNSNCSHIGGCHAGSAQEQWLRADLAANQARCTVAYWHHPLFASGGRAREELRPLFQALYDAGAEVVLTGHNHQYERFAPQNPTGVADPARGIRQFVVGTGGRSLQPDFPDVAPNSEVRNGSVHGVLKLTLLPDQYRWRFMPVAGQTFTEVGTGVCH